MLDRYLIKNGTLMSILDGSEKHADILVENGIIAGIGEGLCADGAEVIDAEGMYVTTGWLDAHCHFGQGTANGGLDPKEDLLRQGVTYALDMGTLGPDTYEEFRTKVRYNTDLRYKSYLYIGHAGIKGGGAKDFDGPEDIVPELVEEIAEKYRGEIIGLKARIDEKFCFDPIYVMDQLRMLADKLDLPVAVHAPRSLIGIEKLLPYLKKGDVLCHTLAGNSPVMEILDENGEILPCVKEAQERGVIMDLSHGTNAYSYNTAEKAWAHGFFTDTVSSDLHGGNVNGPVFNLGVVMTKVKGLTGKPWYWVLNKTIAEPVRLQHLDDKAVTVEEGMRADLTVFKIEKGEFSYLDSKKETRTFQEKATAVYTCVGSNVYVCR